MRHPWQHISCLKVYCLVKGLRSLCIDVNASVWSSACGQKHIVVGSIQRYSKMHGGQCKAVYVTAISVVSRGGRADAVNVFA